MTNFILLILAGLLTQSSPEPRNDGLSINGIQPGMHVMEAIFRLRSIDIGLKVWGWEIERHRFTVGFDRTSPFKVSSVRGVYDSTLEFDGLKVLEAGTEFRGLPQDAEAQPLEGEPNRLYWRQKDVYLRVRLQPKSSLIHEVALFDEKAIRTLTLRKPTFVK